MYALGAQKNRLIETVLLSTHNICFGLEIRIVYFLIMHSLWLSRGLSFSLKTHTGCPKRYETFLE